MAKAMGSCGKSYPVVKEKNKSPMERIGASVPDSIGKTGTAKGKKAKSVKKIKAKGLVKR